MIPKCQVKEQYKHLCHSCSAGIASVCVNANGDVVICGSSKKAYGNIYEESLFDIWNNDSFKAFRALNWLPMFCRQCKDLATCMGGCKTEMEECGQGESRDYLVHCAVKKFIEKVKAKKIYFKFDMTREFRGEYLILGNPLRIIDSEMYCFLEELKKVEKLELIYEKCVHKKRLEEILFSFYRDGLVEFY